MESRIGRNGGRWIAALAMAGLLAPGGIAWAGAPPQAKCQAGKGKAGGKYASCLLGAEAKRLQDEGTCSLTTSTACYLDGDCPGAETCVKDLAKYNDSIAKCADKIEGSYAKLETKASEAGDACPTVNDAATISALVSACVDELDGALDGVPDSGSGGGLPATAQTVCYDATGAPMACAGTGQDGELQVGVARSFTDNGNGTITDVATGLVWEKLDDNNANGIHDGTRSFTFAEAFQKIRVLNGDATACIASSNPDVCCTGAGTGACSPFAGFTDWRLPNAIEMLSMMSFATSSPSVDAVFHTNCAPGCTTATCSCTVAGDFWTSTTRQDTTTRATYAQFVNASIAGTLKILPLSVRAVRGGN